MSETDDDVPPEHRRLLSELDREAAAPPALEERIVSALRARGMLRAAGPRSRAPVRLAAAAAGLILLAAGFLAGRSFDPRRPSPTPGPRYALFLLRGQERVPQRPEEEAGRVAEYRAWARGLAKSGRFVSGEKLEDRVERVGSAPDVAASAENGEEEIRGFFVISASDFQDALSVARGCPHLRHGGRILVRPIASV
ncbi:MAG TPA: YciI family protein [Thermoanaerobaculia bacterium]|nr:YciI family protein [Thermoanaerobaculia bacterium]